MKEVSFQTEDGVTLSGFLFEAKSPKAVALLHGATGVPVHYYKNFAHWLCKTKAHHVLIYDYRDNNLTSAKALRASNTTMADWGLRDQPAALDFLLEEYPNLPLHTIGHSLGGFCIPFHANNQAIISHTAVNSGLAYTWAHPLKFMPQILLFWYGLGPLLASLLGYMPGQLLGMKTHIPKGVYWQWRRWCTHEKFHEQEWGRNLPLPDLTRFKGKLRLIACEDDVLIPKKRVKALKRFYPSARKTNFEILDPKHYDLKSIGHIAIFAKKNAKVWPDIVKD